MKRLALWASCLCIIFTTTGTVSLIIGRQIKPPSIEAEALGLQLCDDAPCFMGIQPGKTSWSDAVNIVSALPDTQITRIRIREIRAVLHERLLVILSTQNDETVYRIRLSIVSGKPMVQVLPLSLASLVAVYGVPCDVRSLPDHAFTTVNYPGIVGDLFVVNQHVEPQSMFYALALTDSSIPCPRYVSNAEGRGSLNLATR